jgi:hypothetical protein
LIGVINGESNSRERIGALLPLVYRKRNSATFTDDSVIFPQFLKNTLSVWPTKVLVIGPHGCGMRRPLVRCRWPTVPWRL